MERTIEKRVADAPADDVVLMYPDNQLKNQVRDFDDTHSVFEVLKETFFGGVEQHRHAAA